MDSLQQQAAAIAGRYLAEVPAAHSGRFSEIASADVVETLLRGFASGLKNTDCCEAAGITTDTLVNWQKRGIAEPGSAFSAFSAALKKARAEGKLAHLDNIKQHSVKDWKASAWTLERTDQPQFAIQHQQANATFTVIVGGDSQMLFVQPPGEAVTVSVEQSRLSPQLTTDMHRLSGDR